MKPVEIGASRKDGYDTGTEHSADAVGNLGVLAVSSESLIRFIETTCYEVIRDRLEAGEGSVGVGFEFTHLAPAPAGARVTVVARVAAVDGWKIDFDCEARDGARVLMVGRHRRVVVDLARFAERLAAARKP
ncbi:MAG: thioesterase family protein [Alphaproteobacteria bacterium]